MFCNCAYLAEEIGHKLSINTPAWLGRFHVESICGSQVVPTVSNNHATMFCRNTAKEGGQLRAAIERHPPT